MTNPSPDIRCSACDEVFTGDEELLRHNEAVHPFDPESQERERFGILPEHDKATEPTEAPGPDAVLHGAPGHGPL